MIGPSLTPIHSSFAAGSRDDTDLKQNTDIQEQSDQNSGLEAESKALLHEWRGMIKDNTTVISELQNWRNNRDQPHEDINGRPYFDVKSADTSIRRLKQDNDILQVDGLSGVDPADEEGETEVLTAQQISAIEEK